MFDTPIGRCGLAWGPDGLLGIQLPEADDLRTEERLARRFPNLPPARFSAWAREAADRIAASIGKNGDDLATIRLDLAAVGEFERNVYREARRIAPGQTMTYGALAERIGDRGLARAVGQALGRNPWPIVIPCHRITAASGRTGGFSAHGGSATKLRLLTLEGALDAETLPLFAPPA